ncbi:MAG: hypothetical protein ACJ8R9_10820 [Steroidobacteraceae bacterium]
MYRNGPNVPIDIRARVHFPGSTTAEQRKWLMDRLHAIIDIEAKRLFTNIPKHLSI